MVLCFRLFFLFLRQKEGEESESRGKGAWPKKESTVSEPDQSQIAHSAGRVPGRFCFCCCSRDRGTGPALHLQLPRTYIQLSCIRLDVVTTSGRNRYSFSVEVTSDWEAGLLSRLPTAPTPVTDIEDSDGSGSVAVDGC